MVQTETSKELIKLGEVLLSFISEPVVFRFPVCKHKNKITVVCCIVWV